MKSNKNLLLQIQPDLIERECGGWLAVSPVNASIRIGVTGSTKDDAASRFALSIRKWVETLYNKNNDETE